MAGRKITITTEVDPEYVAGFDDKHLAALWHTVQSSNRPYDDPDMCDLAEKIGWEIIRRWLATAPIEMYHHQGKQYYHTALFQFVRYVPGGSSDSPEWDRGTYELRPADERPDSIAKHGDSPAGPTQ